MHQLSRGNRPGKMNCQTTGPNLPSAYHALMLERVTRNGIAWYASPLLRQAGVPHAFSTRIGGISSPPFHTLNFGNPNGETAQDSQSNIDHNYRALLSAIDLPHRQICRVHQVHGNCVALTPSQGAFDVHAKADAIVGDDPHRVLTVRVADCVPLLLALEDGSRVAAIHAGWRGIIAGVARQALSLLLDTTNRSATNVIAAIGPSIGFDAFEVGPEVLDEFTTAFGPGAPLRRRADGKGHIDLKRALQMQLETAGIRHIDTTDQCTVTNDNDFFSHRRDAGITGRMIAAIAPRERQP